MLRCETCILFKTLVQHIFLLFFSSQLSNFIYVSIVLLSVFLDCRKELWLPDCFTENVFFLHTCNTGSNLSVDILCMFTCVIRTILSSNYSLLFRNILGRQADSCIKVCIVHDGHSLAPPPPPPRCVATDIVSWRSNSGNSVTGYSSTTSSSPTGKSHHGNSVTRYSSTTISSSTGISHSGNSLTGYSFKADPNPLPLMYPYFHPVHEIAIV